MITDDTVEIKTTALPPLDKGDIWATKNNGIFVVLSSRPAQWRGEDRDIYCHIDTWYTVRTATESEIALWNNAITADIARRDLRKQLNAMTLVFNTDTKSLEPTVAATRMLDSYDHRWTPPQPVKLTPEQIVIEKNYLNARLALKNHK